MGAPRPWTDADTTRMVQMHADRATLTSIAKALGRSKDTVHKYAAKQTPPLSFDRGPTAAATHAKVVDAKARRVELAARFLEEAHAELDHLHQPHVAFSFGGKDNVYTEHKFDHPTVEARERIMRTAGTAALRHVDLVKHDSGDDAALVVGLLQRTAAALGLTDRDDATPTAE